MTCSFQQTRSINGWPRHAVWLRADTRELHADARFGFERADCPKTCRHTRGRWSNVLR